MTDILSYFMHFFPASGSHLIISLKEKYPDWKIINLDNVRPFGEIPVLICGFFVGYCKLFICRSNFSLMGFPLNFHSWITAQVYRIL